MNIAGAAILAAITMANAKSPSPIDLSEVDLKAVIEDVLEANPNADTAEIEAGVYDVLEDIGAGELVEEARAVVPPIIGNLRRFPVVFGDPSDDLIALRLGYSEEMDEFIYGFANEMTAALHPELKDAEDNPKYPYLPNEESPKFEVRKQRFVNAYTQDETPADEASFRLAAYRRNQRRGILGPSKSGRYYESYDFSTLDVRLVDLEDFLYVYKTVNQFVSIGSIIGTVFFGWIPGVAPTSIAVSSGLWSVYSMIDSAFDDKINEYERAVLFHYWSDAIGDPVTLIRSESLATNTAEDFFGGVTYVVGNKLETLESANTVWDAFRHVYWNAILSKDFNSSFCKELTDAHEYGAIMNNSNGFIEESEAMAFDMDLLNNEAGRTAAYWWNYKKSDVYSYLQKEGIKYDGENEALAYYCAWFVANGDDPYKRVYLFEDNEVGTSILNLDGFGGLCNTNFDPDELFSDEPVGSLGYNLRRIFDYMEKC